MALADLDVRILPGIADTGRFFHTHSVIGAHG